MTRQEAIALIRKIERMDRTVRAEGTPAVQQQWFPLQHMLRRIFEEGEVKESM